MSDTKNKYKLLIYSNWFSFYFALKFFLITLWSQVFPFLVKISSYFLYQIQGWIAGFYRMWWTDRYDIKYSNINKKYTTKPTLQFQIIVIKRSIKTQITTIIVSSKLKNTHKSLFSFFLTLVLLPVIYHKQWV